MVEIRREFIKVEYGRMHVRLAGPAQSSQTPLLCLHMAPQSGQDYEAFMRVAGKARLVIAPDYPGYGDSDPMPENVDVSIEAYAKAILEVLGSLGTRKIDILGYHTGSKVAVEMALQSPKLVQAIVCISFSTMTPEQYTEADPSFLSLTKLVTDDGFGKWWKMLQGYYDADIALETLVEKYAVSLKSGAGFASGFMASHAYNAHVLKKLNQLETPVMIINPNDDLRDVTPLAAKHIKRSMVLEKPDWKPGFLDIKAQDVYETVTDALANLSRLA